MSLYCMKLDCPYKDCTLHDCKSKNDRNARYRDYEGVSEACVKYQLCVSEKPVRRKKATEPPVPTESEEQQYLFQWADRLCFHYPELTLLYHIPNEGKRSKSTGAKMKREGMKSGVPDIHLPVAKGPYHSLYIELKRKKGSTTTQAQKTWQQLLGKYGNAAYICYGWEEAAKVIEEYLKLEEK